MKRKEEGRDDRTGNFPPSAARRERRTPSAHRMATWWDKTIARWQDEGLPRGMDGVQIKEYFGLDVDIQFWIRPLPHFESSGSVVETAEEFTQALKAFGDDVFAPLRPRLEWAAERQRNGDIAWISFDGFFWFPRRLMGIEQHLYAFYDKPGLMYDMNQYLLEFDLKALEVVLEYFTPDFMTFGEDMSYNHGPMLSRACFDEFLLPYYRKIIPVLESRGIFPIVDTDGDLSAMVPWLMDAGLRGALPLERQAGVDVENLQCSFPDFALLGGFDKMTMFTKDDSDPREAMRREFARLLPAMKRGRFINSVDHQTPPSVSLRDYRTYLSLLKEASYLPASM